MFFQEKELRWQSSRGTLNLPCLQNTVNQYHILLNNKEIDLRISSLHNWRERGEKTIEGRECDRCKMWIWEMWIEGEKSHGAVKGKGHFLQKEVRERRREQKRAAFYMMPPCGDPLGYIGRECSPSWSNLKESILPLQRKISCWAPLSSCLTAGDRGVCRRQITWLKLFSVLHHRFQP